VEITGLDGASYVDKVDGAKTKSESSSRLTITGETDRVYTPAGDGSHPVSVVESGKTRYTVTRDNLSNVVVWNPWTDKAASIADFASKDGFKNMVCIEPGAVGGWQSVEPGDAFEGAQTITISQ
jgi:glucose-6-phosphate 1-epimerase